MKYVLSAIALLACLSAVAAQTVSPGRVGVNPTTDPEPVYVLDKTNVWNTIGTMTGGVFTPVGGGGSGGDVNVAEWAGTAVGAPTAYGTPPSGLFPGVNAFITNIPHTIVDSSTPAAGSVWPIKYGPNQTTISGNITVVDSGVVCTTTAAGQSQCTGTPTPNSFVSGQINGAGCIGVSSALSGGTVSAASMSTEISQDNVNFYPRGVFLDGKPAPIWINNAAGGVFAGTTPGGGILYYRVRASSLAVLTGTPTFAINIIPSQSSCVGYVGNLPTAGNGSGSVAAVSVQGNGTAALPINTDLQQQANVALAAPTAPGTSTSGNVPAFQGVAGGVALSVNCISGCSGGGGGGSGGSTPQTTAGVDINVSTISTTQLVAAVSGQYIYPTAYDFIAAGTTNLSLEYGTGSNCGTGTTVVWGPVSLTAQSGEAKGAGLGVVIPPTAIGNALCLVNSAAVQVGGSLVYTQSSTQPSGFGGGGGGGGASVGTNGATAPTSSNQIGSTDGSGNLQPASAVNPIPVDASGRTLTVANPAMGSVNSAYPGSAAAIGANANGLLVPLVQAGTTIPISVSTAVTTQLVAAVSGKGIYVTERDIIASGTTNVTFEYGTGSNCGTGTTTLTGAYPLVAQFGFAISTLSLIVPASNALCMVNSAAVPVNGSLSYSQR